MTALGPFTQRLAGRLSGGMKQKLGLACTLVRSPELLLLDEPTVGVDPLSRRELWEIILQLVHDAGPDGAAQHLLPRRGRALRPRGRAARGQGAGAGPAGGGEPRWPPGRTFLAEPPRGRAGARACRRGCSTSRTSSTPCPRAAGCASCAARRTRAPAALAGSRSTPVAARGSKTASWSCCAGRSRAAGSAPAAMTLGRAAPSAGGGEAVGRGPRPGAALRRLHRRRSRQLRGAPRRDLRPARAQRRRQDHDLPHALRPAAGDRRHAAASPASTCARARASARAADRLCGAEVLALRPALGRREPGVLRQRLRPARRAQARAHRLGAGAVRA